MGLLWILMLGVAGHAARGAEARLKSQPPKLRQKCVHSISVWPWTWDHGLTRNTRLLLGYSGLSQGQL